VEVQVDLQPIQIILHLDKVDQEQEDFPHLIGQEHQDKVIQVEITAERLNHIMERLAEAEQVRLETQVHLVQEAQEEQVKHLVLQDHQLNMLEAVEAEVGQVAHKAQEVQVAAELEMLLINQQLLQELLTQEVEAVAKVIIINHQEILTLL
jgi:hypothetical protein